MVTMVIEFSRRKKSKCHNFREKIHMSHFSIARAEFRECIIVNLFSLHFCVHRF